MSVEDRLREVENRAVFENPSMKERDAVYLLALVRKYREALEICSDWMGEIELSNGWTNIPDVLEWNPEDTYSDTKAPKKNSSNHTGGE